MTRRRFTYVLALTYLTSLLWVFPALAYDSGVAVQTIVKTTTASDGKHIEYLKTDHPEVTAAIVVISPGAETGWHLHDIPVYAYVLQGTLEVAIDGGKSSTFETGQVIIEVLNTPHNGRNIGKDAVKLVVFYTGEEGRPLSVKVAR
jgi:quercetin dioxygenase-like cupin family protein